MRIAVVGFQRTGSTKLSAVLGKVFCLTNLNEIVEFTQPVEYRINKFKELDLLDNYVVKLQANNFNDIDMKIINWTKFDFIFSSTRHLIVDAFISLQIAVMRNNFTNWPAAKWSTDPFTVNINNINRWCNNTINPYAKLIEIVKQQHPVFEFEYNEINDTTLLINKLTNLGFSCNIADINLDIIPTGINYREKCLNYAEVEQKFKEMGLI